MSINSKQAKEIPIQRLLDAQGHKPVKQRGRQFFYISPFRSETDPSFNINIEENTWFDFGEGEGGNILDLAMRLFNCSFKEALQKLEPLATYRLSQPVSNPDQKSLPFSGQSSLEIVSIASLQNNQLIEYLRDKRKLDIDICKFYLEEIYFLNKEKKKTYFAFGWKNQSGGYEIRNPYFKSVIGEKSISLYPQAESSQLYLFEGITDFLSLLSMQGNKIAQAQVIVLNSLSFLKKAQLWAKQHEIKMIACYFDNDEAGHKAGLKMQEDSSVPVELRNGYYQDHKDVNDWWVARNSKG